MPCFCQDGCSILFMHEGADLTLGESPFRNQHVIDFADKNVLGVHRISIPADLHHLCVGIIICPDGPAGLNPFSVHIQTMLILCTVDKSDMVPFAVEMCIRDRDFYRTVSSF